VCARACGYTGLLERHDTHLLRAQRALEAGLIEVGLRYEDEPLYGHEDLWVLWVFGCTRAHVSVVGVVGVWLHKAGSSSKFARCQLARLSQFVHLAPQFVHLLVS